MRVTEIKTPAEMQKWVMEYCKQQATALNGFMDKLPEGLKTELKGLHDQMNEWLSGLKPLEQVPAAQEAGWALQMFADTMLRMQDYANSLFDKLNKMKDQYTISATALNGLQEEIKAGNYLTKEKHLEQIELAKSEGASQLRPEILATRKSVLEACGLPVPDDAVLGLPLADYTPRFEAAKANVTKLGEKGLKVGGKGAAAVKRMAWYGATEFNTSLTELEELFPSIKAGGTTPDPLLGNPGATAPANEDKGPKVSIG